MSPFPSFYFLVPYFPHFIPKARHVLGQTTHVRFARGYRLWWPWPKLFTLSRLSSPSPASACIGACMYANIPVASGLRVCSDWTSGSERLLASYLCVVYLLKPYRNIVHGYRGHFPSTDSLNNCYFYSCDCIDLNQVSLAVFYLNCLSWWCEEAFQIQTHSFQQSERYCAVRVMVSDNGWVTLLLQEKSLQSMLVAN